MPKTQIIPCTKEEMDSLIKASDDNDFWYMFFNVAKKTGRRLGEYYDVKVKDIDLENGLMITKVLKRRQKVEREAILDNELIYLMKRYITQNKLKLEDYMFRKVGYRQIQNKVQHYAKKAEIPHKVSFHNFRHYLVTALLKKGWNYEQISKLTGHGHPGTLSAYDHTVARDVAEKAKEDIRDL